MISKVGHVFSGRNGTCLFAYKITYESEELTPYTGITTMEMGPADELFSPLASHTLDPKMDILAATKDCARFS